MTDTPYTALAKVIRERVEQITLEQDRELLRVLARLLEGASVHKAFGAPGDWGYGTPIGDALAAAYKLSPAEHVRLWKAGAR